MALSKLDSTALGILSGNISFASGQGIDFSATSDGSGTTTSELLDDYERGSCTLTLNGGTTNPTTAVTTTAYYEKIGRICTVNYDFTTVTTTGASGSVQIDGLPFACNAQSGTGTNHVGNGEFMHYSMMTSSFTATSIITTTGQQALNNGTQISFIQSRNAGAWAAMTHNAGTSRSLRGTFSYYTD